MNKSKVIGVVCLITSLLWLVACKNTTTLKTVAEYVGDPANGLSAKQIADGHTVVCQLIPGNQTTPNTENEYRFRVYVESSPESIADSTLYFLNYHSPEMFRLLIAADTLYPVLSERVANGSRDRHEFTLLFNQDKPPTQPARMELVIDRHPLFSNDIVFKYQYSDITKASKTLYGYDQVQN